jgi:hypothetical protein
MWAPRTPLNPRGKDRNLSFWLPLSFFLLGAARKSSWGYPEVTRRGLSPVFDSKYL